MLLSSFMDYFVLVVMVVFVVKAFLSVILLLVVVVMEVLEYLSSLDSSVELQAELVPVLLALFILPSMHLQN
jgi:hypothetical protein